MEASAVGPSVVTLLVSSSLDCTVGTWDDGGDGEEDGRWVGSGEED